MAISTNYTPYGQGYAAALYNSSASTAVTVGTGDKAKQTTLATKLREDLAVEVKLSPQALQALATLATSNTENTEEAILGKLKTVLLDIFLESTKESAAADKALPKDPAKRKAALQATDFLVGNADNPFAGQSQANLALVVVDPNGQYTVNQRRAAFAEFTKVDDDRLSTELEITEAGRAAADSELPPSNKPERVASAKQATAFLNDSAANPFAGKTRDELTAIIYNDTGDYTRNERLAALTERSRLEDVVRKELGGTPDQVQRRAADREVPANTDPARRERARQAMRFTYGLSPNPFAGLTREELNAVVFDESKTYTFNERRAAYAELSGTTPPTAKATQKLWPSMPGMGQIDPFSSDGAYSLRSMQYILNSQNTSTLLGILSGTTAEGSGTSGGLLGMLSA